MNLGAPELEQPVVQEEVLPLLWVVKEAVKVARPERERELLFVVAGEPVSVGALLPEWDVRILLLPIHSHRQLQRRQPAAFLRLLWMEEEDRPVQLLQEQLPLPVVWGAQ
jgi:hypothetical protein